MEARDDSRKSGEPLAAGQAELEGESIVATCDVTDCLYNQAQHCTAGAINVAFVNGMAQCATYSPRAEQGDRQARPERTGMA